MRDFFNQVMRRMQGNNKESEAWNRNLFRESIVQERVLNRPWDELTVSAIDSETTGFYPEAGDEMISLAAVKSKGGNLDTPFHTYIRIQGSIPPHISHLTGIVEQCLVGAPPIEQALLAFFNYVENTILIGFYIGHDVKFINYQLWRKSRTRLKHRVLEVKSLIDLLFTDCRDLSFDGVCRYFEIENLERHTAIGDAVAVAALWNRITQELKAKDIANLSELYQQLAIHHRQI